MRYKVRTGRVRVVWVARLFRGFAYAFNRVTHQSVPFDTWGGAAGHARLMNEIGR